MEIRKQYDAQKTTSQSFGQWHFEILVCSCFRRNSSFGRRLLFRWGNVNWRQPILQSATLYICFCISLCLHTLHIPCECYHNRWWVKIYAINYRRDIIRITWQLHTAHALVRETILQTAEWTCCSIAEWLRFVLRPELLHRRLPAWQQVTWIRQQKRGERTDESKRRRGHHAQCQAVTATKPSACTRYVYPIPALFWLNCQSTAESFPTPSLSSSPLVIPAKFSVSGSPTECRQNWFLMVLRRITLAPKRHSTSANTHNRRVAHNAYSSRWFGTANKPTVFYFRSGEMFR